jgi:hypothetical protein
LQLQVLERQGVGNGAAIVSGGDLVPGIAAQGDEFPIVDRARRRRRLGGQYK